MQSPKRQRIQNHPDRDNPQITIDSSKVPTLASSCFACASNTSMGQVVEPNRVHLTTTRGWALSEILSHKPFIPVPRVSALDATATQAAITQHEQDGIPYIIEGFHKHEKWPKMFTPEWLSDKGPQEIHVRNIHTYRDTTLPVQEFLSRSRKTPPFIEVAERERYYGKDVQCPQEWSEWLINSQVVPSQLVPNNDENLLQALPQNSSVETLMCYLGIGDTFTPSHKDLCASSGHNLMCYTEKDGSAFWFMTKNSDSRRVSEFFHTLNQELDHETHVTTLEEFSRAPFDVYVAEQIVGDLVLVPPRSCHQVVNYGGITMKMSWSRMTFDGLITAFYHELPLYRRVCRPETYRVKSTFYHTVRKFTRDLSTSPADADRGPMLRRLNLACKIFDDILVDEYDVDNESMHYLTRSHDEVSDLQCDFCGADIFQSYFACKDCVKGDSKENWEDGLAICPGCYIEGRSCKCKNMEPIQYRKFSVLKQVRTNALEVLRRHKDSGEIIEWETFESEDSLFNGRRGVFRAACIFAEARKAQTQYQSRVCSKISDKKPRHDVPSYGVINCAACHKARCLLHLLTQNNLHALDVMLQREYQPNRHHQSHADSKRNYESGLHLFRTSEEAGTRPDSGIQRVNLALSFETCKPFNPEYLALGWYDRSFVSTQASITSMASVFDIQPPSSSVVKSSRPASSRTTSHSRLEFDCVLVPTFASLRLTQAKSSDKSPQSIQEPRPSLDLFSSAGEGDASADESLDHTPANNVPDRPVPSSSKRTINRPGTRPNTVIRKPITSWQPSTIKSGVQNNEKASKLANLKIHKVQTRPVLDPGPATHSNTVYPPYRPADADIVGGLDISHCPRQELEGLVQNMKREAAAKDEENESLRWQLRAKDKRILELDRRLKSAEGRTNMWQTAQDGWHAPYPRNGFSSTYGPRHFQNQLLGRPPNEPHRSNIPTGPRNMNHPPRQADHEWPPPAGPSQSSLQRDEIESVGSDMDIGD